MAKKKSRKSRTSKGIHGSSAKARTSFGMQRLLNQQAAWIAGKRVMVTTNNSDPSVGGPFIKVEARQVWGLPPAERRASQQKQRNAS